MMTVTRLHLLTAPAVLVMLLGATVAAQARHASPAAQRDRRFHHSDRTFHAADRRFQAADRAFHRAGHHTPTGLRLDRAAHTSDRAYHRAHSR